MYTNSNVKQDLLTQVFFENLDLIRPLIFMTLTDVEVEDEVDTLVSVIIVGGVCVVEVEACPVKG